MRDVVADLVVQSENEPPLGETIDNGLANNVNLEKGKYLPTVSAVVASPTGTIAGQPAPSQTAPPAEEPAPAASGRRRSCRPMSGI
jgi:hypothetical protein